MATKERISPAAPPTAVLLHPPVIHLHYVTLRLRRDTEGSHSPTRGTSRNGGTMMSFILTG
ncbi:hypothetical protein C0Q70_01812 [Pomacea canaliculata]|uniref:Uncharacterized protein n=1 Tax=Pomacea canaliculata TaxID=400727 RepID=A0A2T7Q0I6_POMCA|nr:hypothetical protein C0Q70_01812 [Pomacea canaliculata]